MRINEMKLLFVPPYCRCHYRSLSCVDVLCVERSDVTIFLISFSRCDVTFSLAGFLYRRNIRRWHVKKMPTHIRVLQILRVNLFVLLLLCSYSPIARPRSTLTFRRTLALASQDSIASNIYLSLQSQRTALAFSCPCSALSTGVATDFLQVHWRWTLTIKNIKS